MTSPPSRLRWAPLVVLTSLGSVTQCQPPAPNTPAASVPVTAPVEPDMDGAASPPAATSGAVSPGQARCGDDGTSCSVATELCCIDPAKRTGRCVPRPADQEQADRACWDAGFPVTLGCDEAADCGAGQACCIEGMASGDTTVYGQACGDYPCNMVETCVPGAACKDPAFVCEPSRDESLWGGTCVLAASSASCGQKRCSGTTPVCCWDPATRTERCVATPEECHGDPEKEPPAETLALSCATPGDCGGYPCARQWMGPPTARCTSRWAAGDMGFTIFCDSVADCPEYAGRPLTGCTGGESLPAWLKACDYVWPE